MLNNDIYTQKKGNNKVATERQANALPVLPIRRITVNHTIYYPTPYNLHYGWSFGSLAGIFLAFQIITGFFLAMHYVPNIDCAFNSIDLMMREVNYGWTLRFMHANGASLLFLMLYLHIGKALYFRSYTPGYTRALLFYGGIIIFLLMMGTAFIGYVLPWGQMSLWGATVITNLLSAIPFVGEQIAHWIWGGFAVGNPTLNRFYSFHYMLPFVVVAFILLHLTTLHVRGSTNPLGTKSTIDHIDFFPYYYVKDAVGLFSIVALYCLLVYFFPNVLGHSDNFIKANSLITPTHIVPEWYFLPFYAILRACPNKLGGVVAMLSSILILFILPTIDTFQIKTPSIRRIFRTVFCLFVATVVILGILGGCPADGYYVILSQIFSVLYFSYFALIIIINIIAREAFIQGVAEEKINNDFARETFVSERKKAMSVERANRIAREAVVKGSAKVKYDNAFALKTFKNDRKKAIADQRLRRQIANKSSRSKGKSKL